VTTEASLSSELASDMLDGATAIAIYLFGDPNQRRRVYHLASTGQLPVVKLGQKITGRKSTLKSFLEMRERQSLRMGIVESLSK
jgi:hypothetical protein